MLHVIRPHGDYEKQYDCVCLHMSPASGFMHGFSAIASFHAPSYAVFRRRGQEEGTGGGVGELWKDTQRLSDI